MTVLPGSGCCQRSGPWPWSTLRRSRPARIPIRRADGSLAICLLFAAPVTYEGTAAVCAQFIDVTEEVRLRELAAHVRDTDLALSVAAGVAHDFSNLLTGVLGYLDVAAEELRPGRRRRGTSSRRSSPPGALRISRAPCSATPAPQGSPPITPRRTRSSM